VVFLPSLAPERLRSVAQAADVAGLAELWLWEDCFKEGAIAATGAALAWTSRLRVGIGLLPVPGPVDEAVLVVAAVPLFVCYRPLMREAWRRAG